MHRFLFLPTERRREIEQWTYFFFFRYKIKIIPGSCCKMFPK